MSAPSAFWKFSLKFYGRRGVSAACVELQDSAGIDVNCMFLIIYLSYSGRILAAGAVAEMHALTGAWREQVVVPLRGARRYLKSPAAQDSATAALRADIKRAELEAERLQQLTLEAAFPCATTGKEGEPRAALAANLELFERHVGGLPRVPFARLRDIALAELEAND